MCENENSESLVAMINILRVQNENIALMMNKMQLDIELRTKRNKWWKPGYLKEKRAINEKAKLIKNILIEGNELIESINLAISSRAMLTVAHEMNEKAIIFESRYRDLAVIHATLNQ